jgi:amidase
MTGMDGRDPATASQPQTPIDYTQFLEPAGLKGARLGVARNLFGKNPFVDQVIEGCLQLLKAQGAELIDPVSLETEKYEESEYEVLLYEFKADLNVYLGSLGTQVQVHSLEEVIAFNERHKERVMPYFGQERMLKAQAKGPLSDEAYQKALADNLRLSRTEGIDAVLQTQRLDAIIAPTGGPAWPTDWVNGDHYGGSCSSAPAVAGYPHITVPAGYVFGLPVGLSFFASAWQEAALIRLAYAFEQAAQVRQPPRFLLSAAF